MTKSYAYINASYPKPSYSTTSAARSCSVPVTVDSSGGRFLVNELQPPFSRVHACLRNVANPRENCRIEDSGYQGTYNLLRFGGQQQLEYDRVFNPLAAASYNKHERSLAEVERPRVEARARNSLRETSFDRVMIHSSCVPQPERFRARFPMSHQNDTYGCNFPRLCPNPSMKSGGGLVGPRNDAVYSTDTAVVGS